MWRNGGTSGNAEVYRWADVDAAAGTEWCTTNRSSGRFTAFLSPAGSQWTTHVAGATWTGVETPASTVTLSRPRFPVLFDVDRDDGCRGRAHMNCVVSICACETGCGCCFAADHAVVWVIARLVHSGRRTVMCLASTRGENSPTPERRTCLEIASVTIGSPRWIDFEARRRARRPRLKDGPMGFWRISSTARGQSSSLVSILTILLKSPLTIYL